MDMISFFKNTRGIIVEGSRASREQKEALNRLAQYGQIYTDLHVEITTRYGDSDHEPFLDKGMAGGLLIETDWSDYRYYHTPRDQMVYQDILYGLEVVKVAAAMLAEAGIVFRIPTGTAAGCDSCSPQ